MPARDLPWDEITTKDLRPAKMATKTIQNVSNGFWLKPSNVERQIIECAVEWVEPGLTVRSLTLAESVAARNAQAKVREPLEYAEIPGLTFAPPASGVQSTADSRNLVREAHVWASRAA